MTEIADLERKRDAAWREFHFLDAELERRKQKTVTPEEQETSLEQCRNIGRNISHRA